LLPVGGGGGEGFLMLMITFLNKQNLILLTQKFSDWVLGAKTFKMVPFNQSLKNRQQLTKTRPTLKLWQNQHILIRLTKK
jgi:hypothetical protein